MLLRDSGRKKTALAAVLSNRKIADQLESLFNMINIKFLHIFLGFYSPVKTDTNYSCFKKYVKGKTKTKKQPYFSCFLNIF